MKCVFCKTENTSRVMCSYCGAGLEEETTRKDKVTKQPLIRFTRLSNHAVIPTYATLGSVGADIYASEGAFIAPLDRKLVSTGIAIHLPEHYEAQVRPRSGLAAKHGITVLNAPGTIDYDFAGEIRVILVNLGKDSYQIKRGDRIAQLVIAPVCKLPFIEVTQEEFDSSFETVRGTGGFGSTGE